MSSKAQRNVVAIDLGAESGRVFLCEWDGNQGRLRQVRRFPNAPQQSDGHWFWDTEYLWGEILRGVATAADASSGPIDSIGIDGWAVDYVLLDRSSHPIGRTFCYRDPRSEPQLERALSLVPKQRIYEITGIQFLPFNTLYQFLAHADKLPQEWEQTVCWLNLPEYFLFRLSGVKVAEYTNATHTQLVDLSSGQWSAELADAFGLNLDTFPPIVQPGTVLGKLRSELTRFNLAETRIIAPCCHDTGSAVVGIPVSPDRSAFLSSGTWSLTGTVLSQPVVSEEALKLNFSNEGGICGTIRFLKNVIGLWLLQQCLEEWKSQGSSMTAARLVEECGDVSPVGPFFVADSGNFLAPGNMVARINQAMQRQGFEPQSSLTEIAKAIFRSLARRYAEVIDEVRQATGKRLEKICIVGGGVKNETLNRLTQRLTGLEVLKGPSESAAAGNAVVQIASLEGVQSLEGIRDIALHLA
jgi:rhamnulokinase